MRIAHKILTAGMLPAWREELRQLGKKLVATNGCFDLLHAGHVTYLEGARDHGDVLLVGVNSDVAVRGLKGPGRPVNSEANRAFVVAALQCVDAVFIFPEVNAVTFLSQAKPDVYVKGGDYTIETINQEERRLVESLGGRIVLLPLLKGLSTTSLLAKSASATCSGLD